MVDEPLKFRCYNCNQLLGVPQRKAGSVIECPRCKVELAVPRLEPEPAGSAADRQRPAVSAQARAPRASGAGAVGSNPLPPFMEAIAAAIPDDLVSLRPEDIRVEAEFIGADIVTDDRLEITPSGPPPPVPDPLPQSILESVFSLESEPVKVIESVPDVPPASPETTAATGAPVENTLLPPIAIEPPSILPREREFREVREVALQPATILAWSLI